jgi:hypothetical protein
MAEVTCLLAMENDIEIECRFGCDLNRCAEKSPLPLYGGAGFSFV